MTLVAQFQRAQARVGIPPRYRTAGAEVPDPDLPRFIYGLSGRGKTHLMAAAANTLLTTHRLQRDWAWELEQWRLIQEDRETPDYPLLFTSVTSLMLEIKSTFGRGTYPTEQDVLRKYAKVPYLFLDDFGVQLDTGWSLSILDHLLNQRWNYEKHLCVTSNLAPDAFCAFYGGRLSSRVLGICSTLLELTGRDWRTSK